MSDQIRPMNTISPAAGSKQNKDEVLKDPAKADYKAGRESLSQGDYAQAAMFFHNALRGFEEQGDDQGIANASDRLGDVCIAREEYKMALDHYQRAYDICQKEHDIFSVVALNNKRALAFKKLGDLNRALEILMDIFDHHSQTRNPKGTVEVLEMIVEVYLEKGENLKAADALRTISGIHRNFKHNRLAEEYEKRAQQAEQV